MNEGNLELLLTSSRDNFDGVITDPTVHVFADGSWGQFLSDPSTTYPIRIKINSMCDAENIVLAYRARLDIEKEEWTQFSGLVLSDRVVIAKMSWMGTVRGYPRKEFCLEPLTDLQVGDVLVVTDDDKHISRKFLTVASLDTSSDWIYDGAFTTEDGRVWDKYGRVKDGGEGEPIIYPFLRKLDRKESVEALLGYAVVEKCLQDFHAERVEREQLQAINDELEIRVNALEANLQGIEELSRVVKAAHTTYLLSHINRQGEGSTLLIVEDDSESSELVTLIAVGFTSKCSADERVGTGENFGEALANLVVAYW